MNAVLTHHPLPVPDVFHKHCRAMNQPRAQVMPLDQRRGLIRPVNRQPVVTSHGGDAIRSCSTTMGAAAAPELVFARNVTLPALLTNATLHVYIEQIKYSVNLPGHTLEKFNTEMFVNHQKVLVADLPVLNGAVHVISKLIHPLHHRGHPRPVDETKQGACVNDDNDADWEDWEEWLPVWANED